MWRAQLRLGLIPYEMVVARHPARGLLRRAAGRRGADLPGRVPRVSGLCRTVRGPSMQTAPGRVCVDGVTQVAGEKVFVLHMIEARDPSAALSLSMRPETSKIFLETVTGSREWRAGVSLTSHARVVGAAVHCPRPGTRLRYIAASLGIISRRGPAKSRPVSMHCACIGVGWAYGYDCGAGT